ncbi:hypothetical protein GW17_00053876, partial [Ensete ventricosum]
HAELLKSVTPDAGVCNTGRDHQGVVVIWVFALGFKGDPRIASCSGPLLDFSVGISFPCRGAVTTCGRAAYYDVYLPLHRAFRAEGRLSRLSYIPIEVAATYEVLDLVFQIVTFFGVVSVVAVEAAVAFAIPLYGSSPYRVGGFRSPFSRIWRKISVRVELSGVLGSQGVACSALSALFLESLGGGPREGSAREHFRSSRFSTTRASATTYWLALCSISGIVIGGRSTSDQKRREGLIPIMNAWIISDGCASRMAPISFVKRARYGPRGSSSFCFILRRDTVVGFGRVLARKLASNSLAS